MPDQARPQLPPPRKRKERDADAPLESPPPPPPPPPPPAAGNRLLAGYLAHEFLTKGTLLSQRFEPIKGPGPGPETREAREPIAAYADVALLLKTDGAHVPGVLNPTHLARWLRMPLAPPRDIVSKE